MASPYHATSPLRSNYSNSVAGHEVLIQGVELPEFLYTVDRPGAFSLRCSKVVSERRYACPAAQWLSSAGLRHQSPENGNIRGGGRRLSVNWPHVFWNREAGDCRMDCKSPPLLAFAAAFIQSRGCLAGAGGRWRAGNWTLSPTREKRQNPFPLKFVSNYKRSNFENRTE
jgi:hypothetical protein